MSGVSDFAYCKHLIEGDRVYFRNDPLVFLNQSSNHWLFSLISLDVTISKIPRVFIHLFFNSIESLEGVDVSGVENDSILIHPHPQSSKYKGCDCFKRFHAPKKKVISVFTTLFSNTRSNARKMQIPPKSNRLYSTVESLFFRQWNFFKQKIYDRCLGIAIFCRNYILWYKINW